MKNRIFLFIAAMSGSYLHAQNVGIGTITPKAMLHVADSAVLFTGPVTIPVSTPYFPPASGAGSRMMWYPQKAAFRVGLVTNDNWNKDSVGTYSFSSGYDTKAQGSFAASFGYKTSSLDNGSFSTGVLSKATGFVSTSLGYNNLSNGVYATSVGSYNISSGNSGFTSGQQNVASGDWSTSMGLFSIASGMQSFSLGVSSVASGRTSICLGANNKAIGDYSTSMGFYNTSSGNNSISMGYNNIARSSNSLVAGIYNDTTNTNRLFEVGNGTANSLRSNAMTILTNGNIGIGATNPGFPLNFPNTLGDKISLYGNNGNHYGFGIQGSLLQIHSETFATDIAFGYGSSASFIENVRLKGNGNVGIGTNNPTRPLSFPASLGEKILLYPGPNGETGIGVYGNELRLHADNTVGKISFGTQTNAGVYSENALAQRNGVYAFSVLGSLWVNGATYASDERFKQNISAIASPLQKLMQINGVEYEMKTAEFAKYHFQPGRQMGLLAQNVEKVVPEAVNEKDGYKGVDYARLVPLLIEAMKEMEKQIIDQKGEINLLKTQLNNQIK